MITNKLKSNIKKMPEHNYLAKTTNKKSRGGWGRADLDLG